MRAHPPPLSWCATSTSLAHLSKKSAVVCGIRSCSVRAPPSHDVAHPVRRRKAREGRTGGGTTGEERACLACDDTTHAVADVGDCEVPQTKPAHLQRVPTVQPVRQEPTLRTRRCSDAAVGSVNHTAARSPLNGCEAWTSGSDVRSIERAVTALSTPVRPATHDVARVASRTRRSQSSAERAVQVTVRCARARPGFTMWKRRSRPTPGRTVYAPELTYLWVRPAAVRTTVRAPTTRPNGGHSVQGLGLIRESVAL
jgi:hypothetical protein